MSCSISDIELARVANVSLTEEILSFLLSDGRTVSAPLSWYRRLNHGTAAERANWRLIARGIGVHWPDLDEDISVENLLRGQPSCESQKSLQQWLDQRNFKVAG
jgi:hypothetical protein